MKVGFTGTRKGLSVAQRRQLIDLLSMFHDTAMRRGCRVEFHHGAALGADTQAAALAAEFEYHVVSYPAGPDPLVRNREIVAACDVLVAAPHEDHEQQRGGTWATVRYARQAAKPVVMLSRGAAR